MAKKFKLPEPIKKGIRESWNVLENGPGHIRTGFKAAKAAFDFLDSVVELESETDTALVIGMMVKGSEKAEEFIEAFEKDILNGDL